MGGERVSVSPPGEEKDILSPARFKAKQQKRRRKQEPTLKPRGMPGERAGEASSEQFSARKKKKENIERKKERKKKADCIYPNLPGEDKGFPNEMSLVQTFSCQSKSKISFGNAWFLTVFDKAERMG